MKLLLIPAILLVSANAFAVNTYNAKALPCSEVQAIVKKEGQVILKSGWSSNIFVSGQRFCKHREQTVAAYISTADKTFCNAGFDCRIKNRDHGNH